MRQGGKVFCDKIKEHKITFTGTGECWKTYFGGVDRIKHKGYFQNGKFVKGVSQSYYNGGTYIDWVGTCDSNGD